MKEIIALFKLMIAGFVISPLAGAGYFFYARANAPAYRPTAEEIARAESWATFWQWAGMAFWGAVILVVVLAGVGAALLYLLIPALNKIGEFEQAENGLWKPKLRVVSHALDRLNPHRENKHRLYDPNELAMPVLEVHTNGKMDSYGATGGIDYIDQVGIANKVVQAQVMAATARGMNGGSKRGMNQAEARIQSGYHEAQARAQEAKAMLAEKRLTDYESRQAASIEIELPPTEWKVISLADAVSTASPTRLTVGQGQDDGTLAYWDLLGGNAHLRIHGETQSGKTTMQMLLVAQMIRMNWAVVICDRRKFKDWGLFDGYAQLVDTTDPRILVHALDSVLREHERRDAIVAAEQAGNIANLQKPPRRIGVVIDEYGSQATYAAEANLFDTMRDRLRIITGEGASNGIHALIGDQKPTAETWDSITRGNIGGVLVGHIAKGGGISAMGTDQAYLLDKHEFHYNRIGGVVKGWSVNNNLNWLMRDVPKRARQFIDVSGFVAQIAAQDHAATAHGVEKSSPKWDACMDWLKANSAASQSEMVAAFDGHISKGYISRAYRSFHGEV